MAQLFSADCYDRILRLTWVYLIWGETLIDLHPVILLRTEIFLKIYTKHQTVHHPIMARDWSPSNCQWLWCTVYLPLVVGLSSSNIPFSAFILYSITSLVVLLRTYFLSAVIAPGQLELSSESHGWMTESLCNTACFPLFSEKRLDQATVELLSAINNIARDTCKLISISLGGVVRKWSR